MASFPPLTDTILFALAQAIDDAQVQPPREPSHSDLDFLVKSAGLASGDPKLAVSLSAKPSGCAAYSAGRSKMIYLAVRNS